MCKVMEQFFLGFYILAGTYRGTKWGIFLNFFFSFFYSYTYYHKADRWGRLVGGQFPMPVCHHIFHTQCHHEFSLLFIFRNCSITLIHVYASVQYLHNIPRKYYHMQCQSYFLNIMQILSPCIVLLKMIL